MGMMINRRRVCGGKSLPYEAEIEYLQLQNGNVIFDSGIISKADVLSNIVYYIPSGTQHALIIRSATFSWGGLGFGYWAKTYNSGSEIIIYIAQNGGNGNLGRRAETIYNSWVRFKQINNKQWEYNGTTYTSNENAGQDSYNTNSNLIFGLYYVAGYTSVVRIRSYEITYQGITLRDYIPVRVGNSGYFYDKVSGKLFVPQIEGAGEVIIGPDK